MECESWRSLPPKRAAIWKKITAAVKPFVLAMKGVAEIYRRLEDVSTLLGGSWLGADLITCALNFPEDKMEKYRLGPIPPELSPRERFLVLCDTLEIAESNLKISESNEALVLRQLRSQWYSHQIRTAEQAEEFQTRYTYALNGILWKMLALSGTTLQASSSLESPSTNLYPLNLLTRHTTYNLRDLVSNPSSWSLSTLPEQSELGFTYFAEAQTGSVRRLGCSWRFNDFENSYLLRLLNASCLVDPIIMGAKDFDDILTGIIVYVSPSYQSSLIQNLDEDCGRAHQIADSSIGDEKSYLQSYDYLGNELHSIVAGGVN
jgi:hypothetical protein